MAGSDSALIGVQPCGCITLAVARPGERPQSKWERDAVLQIVENGGSIERTTVDEAKAREHFMPESCPHEPKGWSADREANDGDK